VASRQWSEGGYFWRENGHHGVSGRVQMLEAWAGVTVTVGETQQGKRAKADCTEQGRKALTSFWS
jgi:hypothetical protein